MVTPLDRSRAIFPIQNRTPKLVRVLVDAVPKFIGSHPIRSQRPFVGFQALERFGQTLPAQYRPECDSLKTGRLCAVFSISITAVTPSRPSSPFRGYPWLGGFPTFSAPCNFVSTAPYSYELQPSAGTALLTMTSADCSQQAMLRASRRARLCEPSLGKDMHFPTMYQLHLQRIPCSLGLHLV